MAGVNRRSFHRVPARLVAAGAAASLVVGTWIVGVAGATRFTTSAAQAKIGQTESQLTRIEQTIAQEQRDSALLGQEYDAEMVHLQVVRAAIAATDAHLTHIRKTIVIDKRVLARAAVQDYVLGAQGTQITALFSTSANTFVISEEYSDTAVINLDAAKRSLEAAQVKLAQTRTQQEAQQQQAQAAASRLQALQQQNEQASAKSEATFASLKGTLGREVAAAAQAKAEREAAAAAAAAAAARRAAAAAAARRAAAAAAERRAVAAAERRAAAAAAVAQEAAARHAAAAAAAAQQAAQVASALGGTGAAAAQAANEASAAAGGPTVGSSSTAPAAGGPTVGFSSTATAAGQAAVRAAESQLGVPYVWGGETPGVGFDCSGLVQWSWAQAGVSIPRTSQEQFATVPHVPMSDIQPGDLLFYFNLDGTGTVDHVVMYVGSGPYGNQTVIQAPYTGATVSYDALYTYGLVAVGQP